MTTSNNQRKPKRWELYKKEFQIPELRTDEPVGLYPRQSTERQKKKNRQSFEKQTIDNIEDLIKRGWTRELIRIYDQDNGRSAARALEDKEALSQMFADIREKRIRTVRVGEVDRLFRDEDRIDSNQFIKYCKEADCLVLTDRMIYDFSIPRHVDYFRDEVDRAWKFYESQILIRANELQYRARSKGLYAGGPITIGYIVDKNPKSPTYMKYIPYARHTNRSLEIFQWLYDCGGILGVLYERLAQLPYVFPLEEEWVRQQKAFWTNLEKVYGTELDEEDNLKPIGYRISAHGLTYMLGNRVYRGDWPHDGGWIENNHQSIIPKDLFDFAQEVLERNRRGLAEVANYHTYSASVIHDILYPGPKNVKKRYIVRHKQSKKGHEQYQIKEQHGIKYATLATIDSQDIEQVFLEKFTERLRDTHRFEGYEQRLVKDEENKKIEDRRKNLQDTFTQLTERIDGLFLTLQSRKLKPEDRDEFIEERHRLIKRRERVQEEMNVQSPVQVYLKYKDLIDKMGKYWKRYPFEDRQALVALLIRRVYLEPLSHHFMQMTIEWKEFPPDVGIIWRRHADSLYWDEEEDTILRELYPTEPPESVLQALPHRTWTGIMSRASELPVRRLKKPGGILDKHMSLEDLQIIETYGIPVQNLGGTLFVQWVSLFRASGGKQGWYLPF
jgi:Resolvase, N terminal domain/Recombinase